MKEILTTKNDDKQKKGNNEKGKGIAYENRKTNKFISIKDWQI